MHFAQAAAATRPATVQRAAAAPATVLYVHQGNDWIRGSERCLLDLVTHIDRTRVRPVLACNSRVLADAARALGVAVDLSDDWGEQDSRGSRRHSATRVRALMAREHVRLVHANECFGTLPWLFGAARTLRVPILAHLHNPSGVMDRCHTRLHQVAHVAGSSRAALAGALDDGMPGARATVVYNAVDATRVAEGEARGLRAALGIPRDAVVFTALGSMIERKGVDMLLRAVALLRVAAPGARVIVLSDGPERARYETLARDLGLLDGTVHFLGLHPHPGAVLRDASDVVVSASRAETFGISLIEGALFARPAVASDIAGHREAVVRDVTGLLVAPEDPAALAAGMARLAHDATLRARLGAAAQARVMDGFLIDRYAREFDALYAELLARPRSAFGWMGEWRVVHAHRIWITTALLRRLRPSAGAR